MLKSIDGKQYLRREVSVPKLASLVICNSCVSHSELELLTG